MIEIKEHSGTHLSFDDRIYIQNALDRQLSFKEMARYLKKDPTTIAKEVKKRRYEKVLGSRRYGAHCALEESCTVTNACGNEYCTLGTKCSTCSFRTCSMHCDAYVPATCEKLLRAPYVCNGCYKVRACDFNKMFYRARYANDMYKEMLIESRRGINQTPDELERIDEIITPLILKGQSVAHIFANHKDEINCSKRTVYNYIERNALTIKNIDLPRKVRYKKRKSHKEDAPARKYRQDRTYEDYQKYLGEHPEISPVQMDTVEGTVGAGKVLLTLFFCNCSVMLIFLLPEKRQRYVKECFDMIQEKLGTKLFQKLFKVILTDNGTEFQNPLSLEVDENGEYRTKIFYCEPNQSWQKGQIEKNHEFIRYIIPKGKSFDNLTDENVLAMSNHINSLSRESLNGAAPYSLAPILLDYQFMKKLGLHHVPHDEVLLKPLLIKR